jgi:nitrogen regulatory protein P-II 1
MKYIVAIIQPDRLNEVLELLEAKQVHLVTVSNVLGRGRQKGIAEVYRGHKEAGALLKKVKLEIAVNDDFVKTVVDAIATAGRTGNIGDGKIFVLDLQQCMRIRTGETAYGLLRPQPAEKPARKLAGFSFVSPLTSWLVLF